MFIGRMDNMETTIMGYIGYILEFYKGLYKGLGSRVWG